MHLSQGSIAAAVMQSQAAAERLRLSAAESALIERLRAAATVSPNIRVAEPAPQSQFATMGIVSHSDAGQIDLDAALRRRRAVG